MTWKSHHRRGDVLRTVMTTAEARRDGVLPRDVEGVADTFADDLDLLGALSLRWHTRLAGRIEREMLSQPMDLETAVVTAWQGVRDEMPGVRAVLDTAVEAHPDARVREALGRSETKERVLMAVMAGRGDAPGVGGEALSARVGARLVERARTTAAAPAAAEPAPAGLLDRLRAALAA